MYNLISIFNVVNIFSFPKKKWGFFVVSFLFSPTFEDCFVTFAIFKLWDSAVFSLKFWDCVLFLLYFCCFSSMFDGGYVFSSGCGPKGV